VPVQSFHSIHSFIGCLHYTFVWNFTLIFLFMWWYLRIFTMNVLSIWQITGQNIIICDCIGLEVTPEILSPWNSFSSPSWTWLKKPSFFKQSSSMFGWTKSYDSAKKLIASSIEDLKLLTLFVFRFTLEAESGYTQSTSESNAIKS